MNKMSVVFTGHGSPLNAIIDSPAKDGWKKVGEYLPKPKVIIAISAHWATKGLYVRRSETNPQINDMYGFPKELYEVHYEPKGSIEYADKVLSLLEDAEINNDWGIDHGVWSVLCNMYPNADIPVVMVSTDITKDANYQYELGKKLQPLREEGALILASGNIVHNLGLVDWNMNKGYCWADKFDKYIKQETIKHNYQPSINYQVIESYERAIPTVEHYYPFLVALGASKEDDSVKVFNEYRELGSMSMTSYIFE